MGRNDGDGNGRATRGMPKRRWFDSVRNDIREKGLSGEELYDRAPWRRILSFIELHKLMTKMGGGGETKDSRGRHIVLYRQHLYRSACTRTDLASGSCILTWRTRSMKRSAV